MTLRQPVGLPARANDFRPLPAADLSVPELVAGFSIEATPGQLERVDALGSRLPAGTNVFVPFLPRGAMADTVKACRSLREQGLRPVPHLAARSLPNRTKLAGFLSQLAETGADSLLLIAGDRRRAAGPYRNTLDILDSGLLLEYGFRHIGVAGHPEGHPQASPERLFDALRQKEEYARATDSAVRIVTQFAFSAEPVLSWLQRLSDEEIGLPVRIGMPGPAKVQTLLRYAVQCGVGASSQMLARRPGAVSRLLARWSPEDMLASLAQEATACSTSPVAGVHVFPFGGLLDSIDFFTRQ